MEEVFEGPYWDYSRISQRLWSSRDSWARCCAAAVVKGDMGAAGYYAGEFAAVDEKIQRADARYDMTKADPAHWIGWRP